MKYSGHRKLFVNFQNYQNLILLTSSDTKRTLVHLFLFTKFAQRELFSICTQSIHNCNLLSLHYTVGSDEEKALKAFKFCNSEECLSRESAEVELLKQEGTISGSEQETGQGLILPEKFQIDEND